VSRKKVLLLVTGLFGALAIAAAGCGGGDEGGAGGTGGGTAAAAEQILRMGWGAEPPSLDPGLATDTTSSNVLLAIMDPLVRLNPETNEAEPSLAESWDVSEDGKTVTYHLSPVG
jgi:ABC-type oligopeptide transport system substrate-binding subunit